MGGGDCKRLIGRVDEAYSTLLEGRFIDSLSSQVDMRAGDESLEAGVEEREGGEGEASSRREVKQKNCRSGSMKLEGVGWGQRD